MNKLPVASRADLLRQLDEAGGLDHGQARLYGFSGPRRESREASPSPGSARQPKPAHESDRPREPSARIEFPEKIPRLKFLLPTEAETLVPQEVVRPPGQPISDGELAVPWDRPRPPISPLIRWARLAPWLRQRLGSRLPGARLDLRQLLKQVGCGRPIWSLPRLSRPAWAPVAVILRDRTPDMAPFQDDIDFLLRRLRGERGRHGLLLPPRLRGMPGRETPARFPAGAPVLALSGLGQYAEDEAPRRAWSSWGRQLAFRGHALHSLTPVPRGRWRAAVARTWAAAQWDRRPRLPRRGRQSPLPAGPVDAQLVEDLLDLLSPASRVEAPLLRAVRLLLGPGADVGLEWAAWRHPDVEGGDECLCFRTGPAYEARLRRRRDRFAKERPGLVRRVDELIRRHHEDCCVAIAREAELRLQLAGAASGDLAPLRDFLQRCVDRLRGMASEPGGPAGRRSGLATWFPAMIDRLSVDMRRDRAIAGLIAQGLALADTFNLIPHTRLPPGVDRQAYAEESRAAGQLLPAPAEFGVFTENDTLWLEPLGEPMLKGCLVDLGTWPSSAMKSKPLARFTSGARPIRLSRPGAGLHSYQLASPADRLRLAQMSEPGLMTLESDRQRLRFEAVERPPWARRMAVDRFGVFADFVIGEAVFVMRWIPPGKFLMGSPADEPGRFENEGPQHEVTLSRGFWLGETPVTQLQWKTVFFLAPTGTNAEPSHFEGPDDLPVENVTWHEAQDFCRTLPDLLAELPVGFSFHLPGEAQWEYACRAGTDTALPNGPIEIKGSNHAPALDPIAWYGGNAGNELEVRNPASSEGWPDKQYEHRQAGTHRVKLKHPNAFGLYDMIGDVLEWCHDGRRDYSEAAQADPVGSLEKDAGRVARGGAWDYDARYCRSAYRFCLDPGSRWRDLGLRLAAGQPPEAESPAAEPPKG